jgi:hypothetical protein
MPSPQFFFRFRRITADFLNPRVFGWIVPFMCETIPEVEFRIRIGFPQRKPERRAAGRSLPPA